MKTRIDHSRRTMLKQSLGGAAGLLIAPAAFARGIEGACRLTPPQTEGPFYPVNDQLDKDTDLIHVKGRAEQARGEVVYVVGTVTDQDCAPVAGALVEIWQACASGRYNHPSDPNTGAPLDPNFQYWGRAASDAEGRYVFRTIKPGAYPAAPGWDRPPHIHYKVARHGYRELTTQMYFEGEALNARDRILLSLPAAERASVIARASESGPGEVEGVLTYRFDVAIRRVG